MIKKCSVCGNSAMNSMKCNCCSLSFHPSCGNYIRHVWRGGYCPKLECQKAKAARFHPKVKPVKTLPSPLLKQISPDSPNTNPNSGDPTDCDSQNSQMVYRSTRTRLHKKMERTDNDKSTHDTDHYLRSDDTLENSSNCHLCNRKVRALNLRGCTTCSRVFCWYCILESERSATVCKVCKGLCSCKACYTDTYSADLALIAKKPCLDLTVSQ
mmetsp:Transcript_1669/g.3581  ORF Transcript_1669/g.3581 Transcript_1669/m.3581 type:complete len:212 (+) Transcript_1669:12-647(+)